MSDLSEVMDFDHVVQVHDDGTVTSATGIYAPSLDQWEDETGVWTEELDSSEWRLLSGYTGQYGHNGPMMHASEFIGGRMADDILSAPGYYVAIYPSCTDAAGETVEADSWAVAYKAVSA